MKLELAREVPPSLVHKNEEVVNLLDLLNCSFLLFSIFCPDVSTNCCVGGNFNPGIQSLDGLTEPPIVDNGEWPFVFDDPVP